MTKIKIIGFGNEGSFYYFIIKKQDFSYAWLTSFTDIVKKCSSSSGLRGVRVHDEEDDFKPGVMVDKHESYSADKARIDVFYGKDIINLTISSHHVVKDVLLDAIESIADFP